MYTQPWPSFFEVLRFHFIAPSQAGDCFDVSVTLASLLIGVGYNAYVVG